MAGSRAACGLDARRIAWGQCGLIAGVRRGGQVSLYVGFSQQSLRENVIHQARLSGSCLWSDFFVHKHDLPYGLHGVLLPYILPKGKLPPLARQKKELSVPIFDLVVLRLLTGHYLPRVQTEAANVPLVFQNVMGGEVRMFRVNLLQRPMLNDATTHQDPPRVRVELRKGSGLQTEKELRPMGKHTRYSATFEVEPSKSMAPLGALRTSRTIGLGNT